jgi:hypothetical protein
MADDETKTVLGDTSVTDVRLMLDKLADHDVAEVYEATAVRGPSPTLQLTRCAPETSISSDRRYARA